MSKAVQARRVLIHISANQYPTADVNHHTKRIWQALSSEFAEYHVLARAERNRSSVSRDGKIALHLVPSMGRRSWTFFFTSLVLFSLVRRVRPTQMLVQCPILGGVTAAFVSRVFKVPYLVEIHGEYYFTSRGLKGVLVRHFAAIGLRGAASIRVLSNEMRQRLSQSYGETLAARAVVVPNRVNINLFGPPKASYHAGLEFRFTAVGSFVPAKNHMAVIRAFAALAESATLTIVGGGGLKEDYRALAGRLGISKSIVLVDRVAQEDLVSLLRDTDVFLHVSKTEAFPRAVLEAMAMGLPCVVSPVGFAGEAFRDEVNCLSVDPDDRAAIENALLRLATSEALRRRLGEAAREMVVREFEWDRAFSLYRKAITDLTPRCE